MLNRVFRIKQPKQVTFYKNGDFWSFYYYICDNFGLNSCFSSTLMPKKMNYSLKNDILSLNSTLGQ